MYNYYVNVINRLILAPETVTDPHNTVSAHVTVVKDDVTFGVAVGRAVKNTESDQT